MNFLTLVDADELIGWGGMDAWEEVEEFGLVGAPARWFQIEVD